MARRARQIIQGSVVLDSQGLSLLVAEDERMVRRIEKARAESFQVVISAITIAEASSPGPCRGRRDFVLSRLHIEPVTRELTLLAAELLLRTGMSGHRNAIDAVVAAAALEQARPTLLYTSDPDDLAALCAEPDRPKAERVIIIRV
jgi:predicted nucleic acid-binding protein